MNNGCEVNLGPSGTKVRRQTPTRFRFVVISLVAAVALAGCVMPERSGKEPDPVLAIVGDRTIRRSDLERRILDRYYGKRALLGLIREALFEIEAERLGVGVTPDEVERAVQQELSQATAELDRRLAQVGLDRGDVAEELRLELRNALLLEKVVVPQRKIGEQQIQQVYARTYASDRISVRHIALPFGVAGSPSESAVARVRREADKVLVRLANGEDFGALARELSAHPETAPRGGDMGLISKTTPMDPELGRVIFALEVGETSEPIREADYGFHIFRVERKIPARALAEVRDEIRGQLYETPATDAEISAVEQLLRSRIAATVFGDDRWKRGQD